MNIYFSGIGGVGIGPLAEIARDAGYSVQGSDAQTGPVFDRLEQSGVRVSTDQTGVFLQECHAEQPIDWFVHTAALPDNHPELELARSLGIRTAKRDELLSAIIADKNLKLIAIAGTHGKTTTTGMMVWTLRELGVTVSYSVGTTLSFGPSGHYEPGSEYFVYECDEFDRNFLAFRPFLSLITSIDYDHPDTYPTRAQYSQAFNDFLSVSDHVIMWQHDARDGINPPARAWVLQDDEVMDVALAGQHNRSNATLVYKAVEYLQAAGGLMVSSDEESGFPPVARQGASANDHLAPSGSETEDGHQAETHNVKSVLANFPGTDRRFEKLAEGLYSDYGHHPIEIAATLQLARELSNHVVLVYQPHQNTRQHEVRSQYTDCFELAEQIYWLPTYLSRENTDLETLTPEQLTEHLTNRDRVTIADMDDTLWQAITDARNSGKLVLCMGAGSIDSWVRSRLTK